MITALAPAPMRPAPAIAAEGGEARAEDDFAAQFREDDPNLGDEAVAEAVVLALAGLPITPDALAAGQAAADQVPAADEAAPAPPKPSALVGIALPPPDGATEVAATEDFAPPSAEAALRLQMAEDAGEEGPATEAAPPADPVEAAAPAKAAPAPWLPAVPAEPAAAPAAIGPSEALALPVAARSDPAGSPQPSGAPPPPARQVADAVSSALSASGQSDRIELVLQPEELGRVRFELRSEGDRLLVTLTADRPETMDLLRRHLPELRAELEQAGYGGAGLDFGQPGTPGGRGNAEDMAESTDLPPLPAPLPAAPLPPRAAGTGGLDLRL